MFSLLNYIAVVSVIFTEVGYIHALLFSNDPKSLKLFLAKWNLTHMETSCYFKRSGNKQNGTNKHKKNMQPYHQTSSIVLNMITHQERAWRWSGRVIVMNGSHGCICRTTRNSSPVLYQETIQFINMVGDKGKNTWDWMEVGQSQWSHGTLSCRMALAATQLGQSLCGSAQCDLSWLPNLPSITRCACFIKSVKCYPGGQKNYLILSISEIQSQMRYRCLQYTKRHHMSLISHC